MVKKLVFYSARRPRWLPAQRPKSRADWASVLEAAARDASASKTAHSDVFRRLCGWAIRNGLSPKEADAAVRVAMRKIGWPKRRQKT